MSNASLRMTDPIHRDIEELFKKVDLYYDRRKGFYRDQGRPIRKIVSVNETVQAIVAVLLQRPDDARARPGDYFRNDDQYDQVFNNDNISLLAYLNCVVFMRRVDQFLDHLQVSRGDKRNLKFYVAAMLAREITGLDRPVATKLPDHGDIAKIEEKTIKSCFDRTRKLYDNLAQSNDRDTVARGTELLKRLNSQWGRRKGAAKRKREKNAGTKETT